MNAGTRAAIAASILLAGMGAARGAAEAPSVRPWVLTMPCDWWLSRDDGKSHRASIGTSPDGLVLTVTDPNMSDWSESERPRVTYEFDANPRRRFAAEGWASQGGEAKLGMFGVFLNRKAIRQLAGATRMRMFRDGRQIVDIPLAQTPGRRALEACIPVPSERSDSE